jgi:hypothetical protein
LKMGLLIPFPFRVIKTYTLAMRNTMLTEPMMIIQEPERGPR